jgi:predicted CxxxxCH...CXXCH cytochrome family protein
VEALGESLHGDGIVQVALLAAVAGTDASWDPSTRTCTRTCHDRGGSVSVVEWDAPLELDCNSCHLAPPADHYAGPCSGCHAEADADGTGLTPGPLHANGTVDLGDGSGGCGACHGAGDDPSPLTGSHPRHLAPALRAPLECAECHRLPTTPLDDGHFDTTVGAEVTFGALASARGASPSIDVSGRCSDVACHGAGIGGGTVPEPTWGVAGAAACGACHGLPPPAPHSPSLSCSTTACHGGYATPGPGLSTEGIAVHVNGRVDLWPTP